MLKEPELEVFTAVIGYSVLPHQRVPEVRVMFRVPVSPKISPPRLSSLEIPNTLLMNRPA